jgi:hypothetical protein
VQCLKIYKRDYQPYWYALHPQWLKFLEQAKESYFVLGCMDRNEAFAIPLGDLKGFVPDLNQTNKPDKMYWHVGFTSVDGTIRLNLSKVGKTVDLNHYRFELVSHVEVFDCHP